MQRSSGTKLLRGVTPYDIELFKSRRLQQAHPTTVSIYFRTLKTAFQKAVKFGMIPKNPFSDVRNIVIPWEEPIFLSRQSIMTLLRAIEDPKLRAIVIIAICTSMRLGEIVNLKWDENVDLERGFIHLKNREGFVLKARRRRSVPLNLTAMKVLSNLEKSSSYVFCNSSGRPFMTGYISKRFKESVRKAGLPERVHFHTLRHTGASLLVQQNVPLIYVQQILGHSSVRTTQIYAHYTSDHLVESVGRLDALLSDEEESRLG